MNQTKYKAKRLLLPVLLVSALSGCVVYEPLPASHHVVNADGSRTLVQGAYTCPTGYTCHYSDVQGTASYPPVYYGYAPAYVGPPPYFWPPLFFGMGYYFGGHHHRHHYRPRR